MTPTATVANKESARISLPVVANYTSTTYALFSIESEEILVVYPRSGVVAHSLDDLPEAEKGLWYIASREISEEAIESGRYGDVLPPNGVLFDRNNRPIGHVRPLA